MKDSDTLTLNGTESFDIVSIPGSKVIQRHLEGTLVVGTLCLEWQLDGTGYIHH